MKKSPTQRTMLIAVAVGVIGAAGTVFYAATDLPHAMRAWVAAYGFVASTAVGALLLAMFFHVTNARWPVVLRPHLMSIVATIPLLALLFLPIALGVRAVYPWAMPGPGPVVDEEMQRVLEHQRTWNNPSFFLVRSVVYVGAWSWVAIALGRAERAYRNGALGGALVRMRRISAAGIVVVGLTLTFAAFDWLMSLEAPWVSNMYGVYVFAAGLSAAIALLTVITVVARRSGALPEAVGAGHFLALGRLLLMSVVLWAYIAFFQLMLIWVGNLPREVTFYVERSHGSAAVLGALLLVGRFALPFLVLLSRPLKTRGAALAAVAVWMLLANAVDFAWLVLPAGGGGLRILDVAPFLALSGVAVAFGTYRASRVPMTADETAERAHTDPFLAESLRYRSP